MKLHLPSALRKAVLACLALISAQGLPMTISSASGVFAAGATFAFLLSAQRAEAIWPTQHTTQIGDNTYSGYIIDIKDTSSDHQFHQDTFYVNGIGENGGTEITGESNDYIKNPDSENPEIGQGGTKNFWATFTSTGTGSGTYMHTLRFGNSEHGDASEGTHTYNYAFDGLILSGLIVEAAEGASYELVGQGNGNRAIRLQAAGEMPVLFTIGSDMTINDATTSTNLQTATISSDTVFEVAGGKTLTWSGYQLTSTDKKLTVRKYGDGEGEANVVIRHDGAVSLSMAQGTQLVVEEGARLKIESGTVTFYDLSGAGIMELSGSSTLALSGAGLSVGEGSHLVVNSGGDKDFGSGITLDSGAELVVTSTGMAGTWSNCTINGAGGSLVLEGINADYEDSTGGGNENSEAVNALLEKLVHAKGTSDTLDKTLGSLVLKSGTVYSIPGGDRQSVLTAIGKVIVESGSTLWLGSANVLGTHGCAPDLYLYGSESKDSLQTYAGAADTTTYHVRSDIYLQGDAGIRVNVKAAGCTLAWDGNTLHMQDKSLVKVGVGTLTIGSTIDANASSVIDVQEGRLNLNFAYTGKAKMAAGSTLGLGGSGGNTLNSLELTGSETGGTYNLAVSGDWTLSAATLASGLTSATLAVSGNHSLNFGSIDTPFNLADGLTLSLGNGVTYGGKVSVSVDGTGKIMVGDGLTSIGSLSIGLSGLSEKGKEWEGLSLFTGTLTDELCRMLEQHLTSDNTDDNLRLKVDTSGKVTLAGLPVLVWTDGGNSTWQDVGGDNVWTPQGGNATQTYTSGVNVIFAAIDGQATSTVNVSGTVHVHNITVGSTDAAAQYTFNAAAREQPALIDVAGNLSLLADSSATFNTAVNLNRVGGTSITGKGTVTFAGSGTVTASGLVVGGGVTVEVSASGQKNFGGIEVQDGGRFVVKYGNGWTGEGVDNRVHGDGTLVLDVGIGLGHGVLSSFINGAAEAEKLGNLELASGTGLAIGSSNNSVPEMLGKCTNIWVRSGAGLSMNAPSMKSTGVTLHLAGKGATELGGEGGIAGQDNGKLAAEAALSVRNYGWDSNGHPNNDTNPWTCNWNIVLEEDASIAMGAVSNVENPGAVDVSGLQLTVAGTFDAGTRTLTKLGNAILILAHMQAGVDHAGAITVNGGTLEISGLAEGATGDLVATTVDLNNADGDGTGTFKVSGGSAEQSVSYSVGKVVFGQGTEAANTASLTSSAVLEVAEGTTLTVAGEDGVSLDFTGGAGMVKGAGTVVLRDGVTGSGAMGIDDATVVANAAWSDYAGGLYLINGTLRLGADVQVGHLESTVGGSIDVGNGVHSITLTSTSQAGAASNLSLGERVTLALADGTATDNRVKQTLTHLQGRGNLEVGAYGQLLMTGSGETGNAAGSLTLNGGELHLYNRNNAVTLDLSGDVTSSGSACIYVGYGQSANSPDTALNVQGNMTLEGADSGSRLFYQHDGSTTVKGNLALNAGEDTEQRVYLGAGSFTVGGSVTGTSTAAIEIRGATLNVQGKNAEDETNILGELQFHAAGSTLNLGTATDAGYLIVGGVTGQTTATGDILQQKVTGKGTLEVRVASGTVDSNDSGNVNNHLKLKLEEEVTLKKTGGGTWKLYYLDASADTTPVFVNGGTLEVAQGNVSLSTFNVADLQVDGGSAVLDFSRATLQYAEGKNNLTLSGGGTLKSSYSGEGNADYSFGGLSIGGGGGKIESSDGASGMKGYHFDSLSGTGDLDLAAAFKGTSDATRHSLNLGRIKGYSGIVSVESLDENNVLSIDGEIEAGAAGTTGGITVGNGAVTLNGDDAVLKKSGADGFSISGLRIGSGQGLQMDYTGGELGISRLVLEDGARLNYSAAAAGGGAQLVELAFGELKTLFESHGAISLVTDSAIDRGGDSEWFYLGIVAGSEDEIAEWGAETLREYFIDDYTGDGAVLQWREEGGKQKLYLSLLSTEEAVRYWDRSWDDGSGTGSDGARGNGPSNKQMDGHAALWYSTDESGKVDPACAWSQMGGQLNNSTDFTQSTLQLGGDGGKWKSLGMDYVRLSKGSSSATTMLTVLGGKLYGNGATGDKLNARTYISLWAPEAEHFHLLVGGSSFVGSNVTATGGLGFSGNTHIQVQGGTVDHIVGGNHVTNSAATFAGNTYISVYEGGSEHNEEGVPDMENLDDNYGTSVRGGIVGGSTVTATSGNLSGETKTYDFLGHSHIFIYTVLKSAGALPISDGDKNPGNDVQLYNVVGGNAWIGLMPKETQSMVFSGSSNITIDLTHYQNFYHENAARGGLTFEKAIVGGNYSSTGASAETDGTQTRGTVFEYNSQGEAAEHPYASQIEITGTTSKGESITFLGGINGASRRDSTGDGTTTFTAAGSQGILLDLTGGVYRNYVAGGFWFGGSRYGEGSGKGSSYTGTLTSDITVNLNGGEYWRVIGGSVNFDASDQSSCTMTGNTVVTVNGAVKFGMAVQGQSDTQGTQPTQENLGLLLGGSLYSDTRGTFEQKGSTTLNVRQGTYDNTHIVAGDYMVYTDSDKKENSASIAGGTKLVLGGGGGAVTVTSGIVVAGSYLSDTGIGGSVSVGSGAKPETQAAEDAGEEEESVLATQVTVEAGVELKPMANHKVVLVGGNLLLDGGVEGSQGGHTVTVNGDTQITVNGGTINGYIVGGSYTDNSANGKNTLETTGTVHIDIKGGVVNGDVFGGHFSENTSSPDILILHDVNITMSGGTVNGYIFGGSLRKAESSLAEGEHPMQGDLLIQLTGGTVQGGVYAAGNHYNTAGGAELHVRTNSTRVEIGSGVTFKVDAQSRYVVVSGGYLRSGDAATRAKDYSTVGYDEAAKKWADECAVLSFTDAPTDYKGLKDTPLSFQDFDAVEVTSGKLELNESQLLVMHKVSNVNEFGNDSFAKMGAGSLVLGKGLGSFHGQDADDGQNAVDVPDFTGKIILEGGTLTLGGGKAQSLVGGLQVNMFGRNPGNKEDAYLQAFDADTSFNGLTTDKKTTIEFVYEDPTGAQTELPQLQPGVYYIVDGLDAAGLNADALNTYIDLKLWGGAEEANYAYDLELNGENNDQLVLRVHKIDPNEWIWEGNEGNTWTQEGEGGELTGDWTKDPNLVVDKESIYTDQYYFDAAAKNQNVKLDGSIRAGSITVSSGDYTFTQVRENGDGLTVGEIIVGTEGAVEGDAHLRLALANKSVTTVRLLDAGCLELGNASALQGIRDIYFQGGTLKYGEMNGVLITDTDYSEKVAENGTDPIRVQVGDSAQEPASKATPAAVVPSEMTVTWKGDVAKNHGIAQAVKNGLITNGRGKFVLDWQAAADADKNFVGTLEAQEGTLELKVEGAEVAIGEAAQPTAAEGAEPPRLYAEEGATLILAASGEGSGVTVSRAFSGTGTIEIGENVGGDKAVYTLGGANSGFAGTVRLTGNGTDSRVTVGVANALGGQGTTLALAGRAIVAAKDATAITAKEIVVEEGTVNLIGGYGTDADAEKSYTLTAGSVSGTGVLANAQGGFDATLNAGGLSAFEGTLVAGKQGVGSEGQSTWTLSGTLASPEAEVATSLAGTGKVTVKYTPDDATAGDKVLLTGSIGDATLGNSVSIEHASAETVLVLAGQNNTTTGNLIFNGNEIWLGDESHTSSWKGDVAAGSGDGATSRFVLRNGTLGKALENKDGITLVVDTAAKSTVDVGKTAGAKFDEVVINDSGHLRGVGGDIAVGSGEGKARVELYFGAGSYGDGVSNNAADYLIESGGNLVVSEVQSLFQNGPEDDLKDEAVFVMDFSNEGLFELLKKHREEGRKSYLHAISGGDILFNPETAEEQLNELLRTGTYSKLLYGLTFTLGVDGGDLILRGSSSAVYLVLSDESDPQGNKHTVSTAEDAGVLAEKKATLLDKGTTLTVELGEGKAGDSVTVHNLVGLSGSVLEASGEGTVFLDNTEVAPDPLDTDPWVGGKVDDAEHLGQLKGQDTYFDGMIRGKDVQTQFVKTGAGTLTVGDGTESGGMDIAGELRLEDGDFVVHGGENGVVGTLTFAYGEGAAHEKGFGVQGGKVTVGALNETGGGTVTSEQGGTFAFVGDNTATPPENLQFTGNGTLEVGGDEDGGKLALGGTSAIEGLNVQVDKDSTLSLRDGAALDDVGTVTLSEKGVLDLSGAAHETQHTVGTLTDNSEGTGILKGGANTDLTVTKGGSFGGTLSGGGKLTIAKDATFSMAGVKTDANKESVGAWGITVQGSLTLDTSEQHGGSGPVFGDVVFGEGSDITLRFDYNTDNGSTARTHSLTIGKGAHLTLESVNVGPYSGTDLRVRIAHSDVEGTVAKDVEVELKGVSFLHFEKDGEIQYDSGAHEYYVGAKEVKENKFEQALPGMDKNAQAGAELFWSASAPSKSEALANVIANPDSDLYKMLYGLTEMLEGGDKAGLERTLAAGAGASISVLGPALAEDMHRQLISMRNRSTTLTEDLPTDGYDAFPYWHAWITGEGGYHKLDADGFAPGYTLNNWGGSVGADANITQRTSVGLALTAMYGDLDTESADSTSGNIDTVYLSGYLRHAIGAWSHTLALSVGVADVKLDRTVNYGIRSYHTSGSTDGLAFGLLYEVGYTKLVNKRGTFALQPIANVELRHAMIDGYTETGSDAGLQVDDIEQTVLTFGAGVRAQGLVGGRAFNDSAMLEARALVKADVGDRSGTSKHALIHDTTQAEVESAEVGAVGVEAGVGLSVPLGRNLGSVIVDGSVEFRSGWTSANASVGYRISF